MTSEFYDLGVNLVLENTGFTHFELTFLYHFVNKVELMGQHIVLGPPLLDRICCFREWILNLMLHVDLSFLRLVVGFILDYFHYIVLLNYVF